VRIAGGVRRSPNASACCSHIYGIAAWVGRVNGKATHPSGQCSMGGRCHLRRTHWLPRRCQVGVARTTLRCGERVMLGARLGPHFRRTAAISAGPISAAGSIWRDQRLPNAAPGEEPRRSLLLLHGTRDRSRNARLRLPGLRVAGGSRRPQRHPRTKPELQSIPVHGAPSLARHRTSPGPLHTTRTDA